MPIEPIRNDADHEKAVRRIEAIWGSPEDSPEETELDALATLVDAYERRRWPGCADRPNASGADR